MPVEIKRYRNRKLYDTQAKRYITLEQVKQLIKEQAEIRVTDNDTGEDLTAATLSQIIFEVEKERAGFLPVSLLTSLVQSGGEQLDDLRRNIFAALNLSHHYDVEIERRVEKLVRQGELGQEEGEALLRKLISAEARSPDIVENLEIRVAEFLRQRQIPTKNDLNDLLERLNHLSHKVEELADASGRQDQ